MVGLLLVSPFPGEFAGASLKLHYLGEINYVQRQPFPGEFAGASLKHGSDIVLSTNQPLSPANSPGPH